MLPTLSPPLLIPLQQDSALLQRETRSKESRRWVEKNRERGVKKTRVREKETEDGSSSDVNSYCSCRSLLLSQKVLLLCTDTKRNTDTDHKCLSLFLASAGRWCLAGEIKPNNHGICFSSRRVPPPHPHMTCPAFIH